MATFKEYINEANEITALEVGDFVCSILVNTKGTPVEVFNKDGDFIMIKDGKVYDLIMKLWKDSDEVDWEEYVDSFGVPDWDGDTVVINMDKTKLSKLEREIKKLDIK